MGAHYGGLPAANTESVRARGFLVWQSRVNAAFGSPPYHCASIGSKGGQVGCQILDRKFRNHVANPFAEHPQRKHDRTSLVRVCLFRLQADRPQ